MAGIIKNSFNHVTAEELRAIPKHTPREVIAALSGITRDEAYRLSSEVVLALYELYSFLDKVEEAANYVPADWQPPSVDVAGETFEKIELAKKAMSAGYAPYRLLIELVVIYYGEDAIKGKAAPVLALGALILQDLNQFFERFKDLAGQPPSEDEEEAGVEALHSFGPYGIAENLASKYGGKPYDIFGWSAEEVYLELTYQLAKSRYQENLRDIERRKSAQPKK